MVKNKNKIDKPVLIEKKKKNIFNYLTYVLGWIEGILTSIILGMVTIQNLMYSNWIWGFLVFIMFCFTLASTMMFIGLSMGILTLEGRK